MVERREGGKANGLRTLEAGNVVAKLALLEIVHSS